MSTLPFLWLFTQVHVLADDYLYAVGNISGLIGAVLLWWQFILGIRFVVKKLSIDYLTLIKTHMQLGIWGSLVVIAHPVIEMNIYGKSIDFLYTLATTTERDFHISLGRAALILLAIVWISSVVLRKKITRRPWLYIHYLTYPMMFFVFFHALDIGSFLLEFPLLKNYWLLLAASYFGIVCYRLVYTINLLQHPFILEKKIIKKDGVTIYKFKPKRNSFKNIHVGQFAYIRTGLLSEAHPFSIMKFDELTGEITFGIKAIGPFTNQLNAIKKGSVVYLDGPYGVFTREGQNNKPKVIFAGGIGVTPFVELVHRFGGKNTYLFYANKKLENALNRKQFKKELGENYHDVISREKRGDNTCISGRLTAEIINEHVPKVILKQAHFFLCGSPKFMAGVENCLNTLGVPNKNIYKEEFGF